jgi:peptide/nickel transport system ATP-binding protein
MYRGEIVELGPAEGIIGHPLHPYTELLLKSAPKLKGEQTWTIAGEVSSSRTVSLDRNSCRYFGRCPLAVEKCGRSKPALDIMESGHYVACFVRGTEKIDETVAEK